MAFILYTSLSYWFWVSSQAFGKVKWTTVQCSQQSFYPVYEAAGSKLIYLHNLGGGQKGWHPPHTLTQITNTSLKPHNPASHTTEKKVLVFGSLAQKHTSCLSRVWLVRLTRMTKGYAGLPWDTHTRTHTHTHTHTHSEKDRSNEGESPLLHCEHSADMLLCCYTVCVLHVFCHQTARLTGIQTDFLVYVQYISGYGLY